MQSLLSASMKWIPARQAHAVSICRRMPGQSPCRLRYGPITLRARADTFVSLLKGAVAVQLLPYGWDIKNGPDKGWNLREDLYKGMVLGRNASYFSWMNGDPADSFLRRCAPSHRHIRCHDGDSHFDEHDSLQVLTFIPFHYVDWISRRHKNLANMLFIRMAASLMTCRKTKCPRNGGFIR